jgi:hypothetical protein
LSLEDWTRVFQLLSGLEFGLKGSSQPRFLFEGALIRIAGLANLSPIEGILAALQPGAAPPAPALPAQKKKHAPEAVTAASAAPASAVAAGGAAAASGEVREALIAAVSAARPLLGAMLEQASAIQVVGGALIVSFGAGDDRDRVRRMLSGDENVKAIETLATRTLGRPLALRLATPDEPTSAAASAAPSSTPASSGAAKAVGTPSLMDRARGDPSIRKILDAFGAQIVDVRPLASPSTPAEGGPTLEENA